MAIRYNEGALDSISKAYGRTTSTLKGNPIIKTLKLDAKLREISKQKEEFQRKLDQLTFSEEILSRSTISEPIRTPKAFPVNKDKEAKEFAQKFLQQWIERNKKAEERQQAWSERIKREEEEEIRKQRRENEEKLKRRKDEKWLKHELAKRKYEAQKKQFSQLSKSVILTQRSSTPLYRRYEEKYEKEFVLPCLENYRKKLKKKKEQCRFYTKEELNMHWKKYDEAISQRKAKRDQQIKEMKKAELKFMFLMKSSRTPTSERTNQMDILLKNAFIRRKLDKKQLREKLLNYSHYVKDAVHVNISRSKSSQLKQMVTQLKHPVRETRNNRKDYYDVTKIFRSAILTTSKSHNAILKKTSPVTTSLTPIKASPRKPIDYLSELRKLKAKKLPLNQSAAPLTPPLPPICKDWRSDIKDSRLNLNEKYDMMIRKANAIENMASREEKLLNIKGGKNAELELRVNNMLIDTIKAKFAILDQLSQLHVIYLAGQSKSLINEQCKKKQQRIKTPPRIHLKSTCFRKYGRKPCRMS
eukprot:TRINITY_DN123_c0_g1_i1.p1 TRINITY_DN123_c0_g1~~TRINITY_DN123_c0_g1_i1.p1  ORF type:complete len:528 (-),score=72.10 TRINITY_DN123_c0_g1_i1:2633-4216(-)